MGNVQMPDFKIVSLEEAKKDTDTLLRTGYAWKLFEEIKKAHDTGNGLYVAFRSRSSSNKMKGQLAAYANEAGLNLFLRRNRLPDGRMDDGLYFWLEPLDSDKQEENNTQKVNA